MPGRVLAAAPVLPWPLENGLSLRVFNLLQRLTEDFEIVLVCPSHSVDVPEPLTEIGLADIRPVTVNAQWTFSPGQYDTSGMEAAVDHLLGTGFDASLLWIGTEYLASRTHGLPPTLVDRVDCATLLAWRRYRLGRHTTGRRTRWFHILESCFHERAIVRQAEHVVAVSEVDAHWLQRLGRSSNVHVIPNGVAIDGDEKAQRSPTPTAVFTGVMNYEPNVAAVHYFVEEVWPAVRAAAPDATFLIAGRDPVPSVVDLGNRPDIEVLGRVPSIRDVLRQAWVAVAPMVSGAGIKNKVLEAWACGTPTVLSRMAAGGLELDGEMADWVTSDAREFGKRVVDLLLDAELRERNGRLGKELAARRFSWERSADEMAALLQATIDNSRQPSER